MLTQTLRLASRCRPKSTRDARLVHGGTGFLLPLFALVLFWGLLPTSGRAEEDIAVDQQIRLQILENEAARLRQNAAQKEAEIAALREQMHLTPPPSREEEDQTTQISKVRNSLWKHEVSLGGSLTSGNTDSYSVQARATSKRETENDKLTLSLVGDLRDVDSNQVANRVDGIAQYNHDITKRLYGYLGSEGEADEITGLDYRFQLGPGLGYYLWRNKTLEFSVESGPVGQTEKFRNRPLDSTVQARVAQRLSWKITKTLRYFESSEAFTNLGEISKYRYNFKTGLESSINSQLSLRLTAEDRFQSQPLTDRKKNDIGVVTSLVWGF